MLVVHVHAHIMLMYLACTKKLLNLTSGFVSYNYDLIIILCLLICVCDNYVCYALQFQVKWQPTNSPLDSYWLSREHIQRQPLGDSATNCHFQDGRTMCRETRAVELSSRINHGYATYTEDVSEESQDIGGNVSRMAFPKEKHPLWNQKIHTTALKVPRHVAKSKHPEEIVYI